MTSKAIEVNYFEAATELCISVEPLKPLTISQQSYSFYPELVGSPCMPDLYSNFRIFILLEKYSNVAFECLNFVWFLVYAELLFKGQTGMKKVNHH